MTESNLISTTATANITNSNSRSISAPTTNNSSNNQSNYYRRRQHHKRSYQNYQNNYYNSYNNNYQYEDINNQTDSYYNYNYDDNNQNKQLVNERKNTVKQDNSSRIKKGNELQALKTENTENKKHNVNNKSNSKKRQNQVKKQNKVVENETRTEILIEQITQNTYECMVCCFVIKNDTAIWTCSVCNNIFHLFCIKKWARSPIAIVDGNYFLFILL